MGILAALGILCFRRRRRQRLDREVTSAAMAASAGGASHGANRSPLEDEALYGQPGSNGGTSYPSTAESGGGGQMAQYGNYGTTYGSAGGYDPYSAQPAYGGNGGGGGYGGAYAAAAGAAAGGAGVAGYHAAHHSAGGNGHYFDPSQAGGYDDRYDDDTLGSTPGGPEGYYSGQGGGYSDDPYAGYTDQGQGGYGGGNGQAYEGQGYEQADHELGEDVGTPGSERGNPLHVSLVQYFYHGYVGIIERCSRSRKGCTVRVPQGYIGISNI